MFLGIRYYIIMDKWIKNPGIQPVDDEVRVIVLYADGYISNHHSAGLNDWSISGCKEEIISYKVEE